MTKRPTDQIPILDLGPFMAGAPGAADEAAATLRWVQEEIGFYYIVNHGVAADLIARAIEQVRRLHALPMDEKLRLKVDERTTGYVPMKSTIYVTTDAGDNTKYDLNENYRIVRERPADHPGIVAGRRFTGPNKWPDPALLPDFKTTMLAYYQAMEDLGRSLLPLYALALEMPADYFDELFTDPCWLTRNVHYPAVPAGDNEFGISPHTDHGFITLLPVSKVPGLEVKTQDGEWMTAGYVEDAMIVNSGDFMKKWTNGRFIATPHRVLAPNEERHISAFFYNPNWDVRSDPLPSCVDADHPPQFEVTTFLDHLCNYVDSNYKKSSGGKAPDQVADPAVS